LRSWSPLYSFAFFVVELLFYLIRAYPRNLRQKGFAFPITAITAMSAITAIPFAFPITRCPDHQINRSLPQPSACVPQLATHPGVAPLLKTRGQPHFDRPVTGRSKAFSCIFQPSNLVQFQLVFLIITVRSAEGCKPLLWLIDEC